MSVKAIFRGYHRHDEHVMCINDTYVYIKCRVVQHLHERELHLDVIASSSLSEQLSPKPVSLHILLYWMTTALWRFYRIFRSITEEGGRIEGYIDHQLFLIYDRYCKEAASTPSLSIVENCIYRSFISVIFFNIATDRGATTNSFILLRRPRPLSIDISLSTSDLLDAAIAVWRWVYVGDPRSRRQLITFY